MSMRTKRVAVAMVQDAPGRFLLTWNVHWNGYTFPMKLAPAERDDLGRVAIEALEYDVSLRLPQAAATYLEYIRKVGRSARTGKTACYDYSLFDVAPGRPIDLSSVPHAPGRPLRFATVDEMRGMGKELTWSTRAIVRDLVDSQEAVLVVVTRPAAGATEMLVLHSESFGGYFFPAARVGSGRGHAKTAEGLVRSELGYAGPVVIEHKGEVEDVQFSPRFNAERRYRFQIYSATLSNVRQDHGQALLDESLRRAGANGQWVTAEQLRARALPFTATMNDVSGDVLRTLGDAAPASPPRTSEGGIALIERTGAESAWLAQWNANWNAYFLVGGHRHEGESFRDCVVREIEEELLLSHARGDFTVDDEPLPQASGQPAASPGTLEFDAVSRSAGVPTHYRMRLHRATLTPAALQSLWQQSASTTDDEEAPDGPGRYNRWITPQELRRLRTHDGHPISPTMFTVLTLAGFGR